MPVPDYSWNNAAPVAHTVPTVTPDNTAPTAKAVTYTPDNTAPTEKAPSFTPDNTAPLAKALSYAPDNTAPTEKAPSFAPDNTAPTAKALSYTPDNTAPTEKAPSFTPNNTAAIEIPVGAADPFSSMAASFVPAFTSSAELVALATAGATLGRILQGIIDNNLVSVRLVAGTDAHAPDAGVWRGFDYNEDENARVWKLVGGTPDL